jgi:hypothetical protein
MIGQLGDDLDLLRSGKQAGRARQMFGPIETFCRTEPWNAAHRAFRQVAFDRRQAKYVFGSEAQGECVDELADAKARLVVIRSDVFS